MSLCYAHLLIPLSPKYRPELDAVAAFAQGMIENGNIGDPFSISFSEVVKREPAVREVQNVYTGETIQLRAPTRKLKTPQKLASTRQIIERANDLREYDVVITSTDIPLVPPCSIGYVEKDTWKPMAEPCHLEIRCRVRDHVVGLSRISSEGELGQPSDLSQWQPRFDEDCSADNREGIFVHPQQEGIHIPNAGCGTFWVEFRYGKFLFPLMKNGGLNLLNDSIVTLAQKIFAAEFVQACEWG